MKNLKIIILTILFVAGGLFVYFIKCQMGICFIKDFPLDKYPPLNLLQDRNPYHIVQDPLPNINLLLNRILFLSEVGIWDDIWMRQSGMVTLSRDPNGHNNSSCLIINNQGTKDWALGQKKLFSVKPGDVYSFSGWVKTSGQDPIGELSIVLADADMHVIQWHFASESVTGADDWKKVEQKFVVPSGVKYIRFRLCGSGKGKVSFSGVIFQKYNQLAP